MALNYYDILGVPKHATDAEIKSAYRKLAMRHHPDRSQNSKASEEAFKSAQIAFDHLSHPGRRKEHDEYLMGLRPIPQQTIYAETEASAHAAQHHRQSSVPVSAGKYINVFCPRMIYVMLACLLLVVILVLWFVR